MSTNRRNVDNLKKAVRLVALMAAAMIFIHILVDDGRSDWLAIIPGVVLVSAVFHFVSGAIAAADLPKPLRS